MGNAIYKEATKELDRESGANLDSLDELVSTKKYLSPHSDIVALMVMEHQTQMHNAIAAANYETRQALHQCKEMNQILDRDHDHLSESADRRINRSADNVVKHLLMCGEFPLQSPISGTSGFDKEFPARGLRDSKGRSLRDLDLKQRMFRYPCSYLIHSQAFDGLPDMVRHRVLNRLRDVLEGRDDSPEFNHLSRKDRLAILGILEQTKPEFKKTLKLTAVSSPSDS